MTIPDVSSTEKLGTQLKLNHADFVSYYRDPERSSQFDAVATCFFLDSSPNVIRYIETVRNCLKVGGIWSNTGPLLFNRNENGVAGLGEGGLENDVAYTLRTRQGDEWPAERLEVMADDLVVLLEHSGFVIEEYENLEESGFVQDPNSMLQEIHRPCHWRARRCT